jgi:hypothetical protein
MSASAREAPDPFSGAGGQKVHALRRDGCDGRRAGGLRQGLKGKRRMEAGTDRQQTHDLESQEQREGEAGLKPGVAAGTVGRKPTSRTPGVPEHRASSFFP